LSKNTTAPEEGRGGCIQTITSVLALEISLEDKSDLTEVPIPLSTDKLYLESK
jgi:hypothetical protein